jgi:VanZ family protein
MTDVYFFRVLTVGWMAFIFFLSSQPSLTVPLSFHGGDKLLHAMTYTVLGFLMARSLFLDRIMTWKRALLLAALVAAYGFTDEFHQSFVPGREPSGWDLLADGFGGFLAAVLIRCHSFVVGTFR